MTGAASGDSKMTRKDTAHAFDGKAEAYAQWRPDYAPQAIEAMLALAGIGANSVIADLGAGTGMLTRHFADRVGQVFAIEPNAQMRAVALSGLRQYPVRARSRRERRTRRACRTTASTR